MFSACVCICTLRAGRMRYMYSSLTHAMTPLDLATHAALTRLFGPLLGLLRIVDWGSAEGAWQMAQADQTLACAL